MASDGICKTETFDVDALQALCRHDSVSKEQKTLLQKYRKRRTNGGTVRTIYDFGKEWRGIKKGRLYPEPWVGLTVFEREIRAALAQKFYWDIDMANAQPVLLNSLATSEFKLSAPNLAFYVNNRKKVLTEIQTNCVMSRDEAKEICLATIFGGSRFEHPILPLIKEELQSLSKLVANRYPDMFKVASKKAIKEGKNPYASCLAIYIQDQERLVLETIDRYLSSQGRPMEVLIFDGGFVKKKDNETSFPLDIIQDCEKEILKVHGISIQLEQKPLEHSYIFNADKFVPENILVNDAFAADKFCEMAGENLISVDGVLYTYDETSGRWSNSKDGLRHLIHTFRHDLVFKQIQATGVSVSDYGGCEKKIAPLMAQIPRFAKKGCLPVKFEYEYDEVTSEPLKLKVETCIDELLHLMSNDLEEHKIYLKNYIADIFQNPFQLRGIMIILTGKQGSGKDTLLDYVIQSMGTMYALNYGSNNEQYFSKHDTGRMNRFLVKIEEMDRKLCLKHSEELKGFITSQTQVFNPKGRDAIEGVKNSCRQFGTTNGECPVEFSGYQRRFGLFQTSDKRVGPEHNSYWDGIHATFQMPGAKRALAEYFMKVDLSKFQYKDVPKSQYQIEISEVSETPWTTFVKQWDGERVQARTLFNMYQAYCQGANIASMSECGFFKKLVPMLGKEVHKVNCSGTCHYSK